MKSFKILGLAAIIGLAVGCGGKAGGGAKGPDNRGPDKRAAVVEAAKQRFEDALKNMVAHDKASDWTDGACTQVAQDFIQAAKEQQKNAKQEDARFPEALYNAGLAYQRCGKEAEAKAQFQAALNDDPKFHHAKVQLALYDYREKGDAALDSTIQQLNDAVLEAQFQNVDALVNLAMLQMKRGGPESGTGCKDDYECAKINIQRALAIDDGFMPAFNQLALYYFNQARAKADAKAAAGTKSKKGRGTMVAARGKTAQLSTQMLDLAALVCSQAIRKNPKYAPIHNTAGLIQVELKNINSAVQSFNTSRQLDPNFFEAQMNYAAVNLSFRGFDQAENAYRQALKIRPNSYEAWLGLALAVRGQINDSNWDKNVKGAQEALEKCKQLSPERPEAYYNEAILTQEYKAKTTGGDEKATIPILEKAVSIFDVFIQKAGGSAEYADAVKRSTERKEDLHKVIEFLRQGAAAAKRAAEDEAAAAQPVAPAGLEEEKSGGEQPSEAAPQ